MESRKKKSELLLAAGLFLAVFLGPAVAAQVRHPLLELADQALKRNDYAAAAEVLETYLSRNPQDYRAEFNLAYAYSLLGRRADAVRLYRNVLEREKDLLPAHLNLGILLLEEQQAAEALEHLSWVVAREPDNFRAQVHLAGALAARKQVPEARDAYETALRLKPDDAPTHLAYARLLAPTDPAAAESHLRKVLASDFGSDRPPGLSNDPTLEEAQLLLATVLENRASEGADALDQSRDPAVSATQDRAAERTARLAEAAGIYRRYLEAHPERADLHRRLGQLYSLEKRSSEAIAEFEAAQALDSSPEVARELLQSYLQDLEPHRDQALALVRQILEKDADNRDLRFLYGTLWMGKKQYAEAAEQFRRVTELQPDRVEGYTNLASALYLLKDYPGTVAALAKVTELRQDTAGTYFLRAITLDRLELRQPALENYQRFLEQDEGKNPDQEFQARQRIKVLSREVPGGGRRK